MNGAIRRLFAPAVTTATVASLTALHCDHTVIRHSKCETNANVKHSETTTTTTTTTTAKHTGRHPKLVFMGTGSSTGCPKPMCSMLFGAQQDNTRTCTASHDEKSENEELLLLRKQFKSMCGVSNLAIQGNPRENKNYRNNPSLLISHWEEGNSCKNIIIDVGKTFREGALRWMPVHEISTLDGIVLTHEHMDAVAGLDDVRGFQKVDVRDITSDSSTLKENDKSKPRRPPPRVPTPVFLTQHCLNDVSRRFPWLFPKQQKEDKECHSTPVVHRDVASFDVRTIRSFEPFEVAGGLQMVPLPVWHGDDLICTGYAFSITGATGTITNVVYLSDISRMMPETLEYIQTKLPPTDILIVDALLVDQHIPVHWSMEEAIELVTELKPKQTFLVGMNCDSLLPHEELNEKLAQRRDLPAGVTVQLAHDGLAIYL